VPFWGESPSPFVSCSPEMSILRRSRNARTSADFCPSHSSNRDRQPGRVLRNPDHAASAMAVEPSVARSEAAQKAPKRRADAHFDTFYYSAGPVDHRLVQVEISSGVVSADFGPQRLSHPRTA
jgi:hypothetical protein